MSIEVQGVRRAFGDVLAVDSISLTAQPGEVTALIGPNGSGKTTLLLMLATLLVPDQGQIRVDGLDPVTQPTEVRAKIGWMPDGFGTWDALTVREVLQHHRRGIPDRSWRRHAPAADELLHTVHLEDLARPPRPRAVARAEAAPRPGPRPDQRPHRAAARRAGVRTRPAQPHRAARRAPRSLAAQGKTVLVSSHILTELQEVADRAVIVARGRSLETQSLDSGFVATGDGVVADRLPRPRTTGELARRTTTCPRPASAAASPRSRSPARRTPLACSPTWSATASGSIAFTPSQGALESAYLAATEDRR